MTTTAPSWLPYWGKTDRQDPTTRYHLLACHNLDVAAVASALLEQDPTILTRYAPRLGCSVETLRRLIVFCMAFHDLGKFEESFQNLSPDLFTALRGRSSQVLYKPERHHDTLGLVAWRNLLESDARAAHTFVYTERSPLRPSRQCDLLKVLLHGIFGHHGKPVAHLSSDERHSYFRDAATQSAIKDYFRDVKALLWDPLPPVDTIFYPCDNPSKQDYDELLCVFKSLSWSIAGLYVLCDWIGSDEETFTFHDTISSLDTYWHTHALPVAYEAVRARHILPVTPHPSPTFSTLFPELARYTPRPLQQVAITLPLGDATPQLFILEDETGSGKTEAALMLTARLISAGSAQGVYLGLPTMATSNAMYERLATSYRHLFANTALPSLILAHGGRQLSSSYQEALRAFEEALCASAPLTAGTYGAASSLDETASAVCASFFAQHRHLALFADVGVGTIDQALLGILHAKHQSLRLFALGKKVIIIDEVHAYDAYTHNLVCALLTHHAVQGGSAILLSATLPSSMRRELVEAFQRGAHIPSSHGEEPTSRYPMLTHVNGPSISYPEIPAPTERTARTTAICFLHEESEVDDWLLAQAAQGGCVCWVRNTVGDAVKAARRLRLRAASPEDVVLFHARMTMEDRLEVEGQIFASFGKHSTSSMRSGKIIIATQVIEQSLDVDFDEMISDLAPIDLLVQRLGRYRRHARDPHGDPRSAVSEDERGERRFHVLAPRWAHEPEATWYSALFPSAAYVYPRHDHLWRTMQKLCDTATGEGSVITLPGMSRELVEHVYDEAGEVPEGLEDAFFEELTEEGVKLHMAARNTLPLEQGYGVEADTSGIWLPETLTPTRLGEPSTTLRLLKQTATGLEPWASRAMPHPWQRSEVRILARYAEAMHNGTDQKEVNRLIRANMPDRARYSLCVVMRRDGESQVWHGEVLDPRAQVRTLRYSVLDGLEILHDRHDLD